MKNQVLETLRKEKASRLSGGLYHETQIGLREYPVDKNFLIETCLFGQDLYKKLLDYFKIKYN